MVCIIFNGALCLFQPSVFGSFDSVERGLEVPSIVKMNLHTPDTGKDEIIVTYEFADIILRHPRPGCLRQQHATLRGPSWPD